MANKQLIIELYDQIEQWQKEIDEMGGEVDALEEKIDKAFMRINAEKCELAEETKVKLKVIYSRK